MGKESTNLFNNLKHNYDPKDIYYRFDYDSSLDSWGRRAEGEYEDLFCKEHQRYDRRIVYKAFVDAINRNDVSGIKQYLTNPISFCLYASDYRFSHSEALIDKEEALQLLAKEIATFHTCGKVNATIIPICLQRKYMFMDNILVRITASQPCIEVGVSLGIFLNCVYSIGISEFYVEDL